MTGARAGLFRNKRNDRSLARVAVEWATMAAPLL
jgi:hypothetical protein